MRRAIAPMLILLLVTGVSACGQKGPLYLPEPGDGDKAGLHPARD